MRKRLKAALGTRGRGRRSALVLVALAALAAVLILARPQASPPPAPVRIDPTYAQSIQPLFDRRCVPCHACFDSSCQLTLQSFDGLDRGGNKEIVYYPERVTAARPTRMFQDAKTTAGWQTNFDFFPVVDRSAPADLDRSILWRFVSQRARSPQGDSFDVDTTTTCPRTTRELEKELHANPERGMPFGFPPLSNAELTTLGDWLRNGAGGPASPTSEAETAALEGELGKWEDLLNGSDPRTPLVAAYLYEHLFYAHLHFDTAPGAWFRVVRSRTAKGAPIDEIPTRRPYDDPGIAPFYYRLRRVRETLVAKTHVPYRLDDAKLARLRELFFGPAWVDPGPWPYDARTASNPFLAFAAIPARARYQFLLDDARFFVQSFINGPVCRGQAALDVIEEQFVIFFVAPGSDPAVTDATYLPRVAADLGVPADDSGGFEAHATASAIKERRYLAARARQLAPRALADVWHGDGTNADAVLTVFRHFDNAAVLRGAVGGMPKTAWVMDYPIFERMYYDLVAGFDVYGNLTHQLSTRMYMNLLRIEAEGEFLRLVPASERARIHAEWYRGRVGKALADIHLAALAGPEPKEPSANPARAKEDVVTRLLTQELPPAVAGPREPIQWPDVPLSDDPVRARFELAMRGVAGRPGPDVTVFPDTVLLRVKTAAGSGFVYTIARNRSHTSVEFIFSEGVELEPAEDTLQIASGIATSRPNLFLTVDEAHIDDFVARWKALRTGDGSWNAFVAAYGARRSDPAFWSTFDFFAGAFPVLDPIGAAVLDLSRYTND
jgi:hypothetical protein